MHAAAVSCLVSLLIIWRIWAQNENIPASELTALEIFYIETDGANWKWEPVNEAGSLWTFDSTANPCAQSWQGISCTDAVTGQDRHILEIQLPGYDLYGTIPEAIGNLTSLQVLVLPHNLIYGSVPRDCWLTMPDFTTLDLRLNDLSNGIPPALGQLQQLSVLQLSFNSLSSTIPNELANATALTDLALVENRLFGTIPAGLAQLSALVNLHLFYNRLTGTLNDGFYQIPTLQQLIVGDNFLHGSIPSAFSFPPGLAVYDVNLNDLTGTLPPTLCGLPALQVLFLSYNSFTGTLPACLGDNPNLRGLNARYNQLHGPIPATLSALTGLTLLVLEDNGFTGTVPPELCSLVALKTFFLNSNDLSGFIPACLGNLPQLIHFEVSQNQLSGPIPESLLQLPDMKTLWLSENVLTGSVADFSGLSNLTSLLLEQNCLTGTIPDAFSGLVVLNTLGCYNNLFTGTLPGSLGSLGAAAVVDLSYNMLTGPIPCSLANLHSAYELVLNDNHLSGPLDGVFNRSTQTYLQDVFLSGNQLTGSLPDELFLLPNLNTILLQVNCFTGTLPTNICASRKVGALILDGLHTSPACRTTILPATNSYDTVSDVHGTIPACLLNMTGLFSLHLSGNGLTGTLPAGAISARLVDLTVSHNFITGTIPQTVQGHPWAALDLSYNRISGELRASFGAAAVAGNSTAVSLQNNRLSGEIAAALVHMKNVSILGSNMFSCKADKSDIPDQDADKSNYQCGSDAFNGPFCLFLAILTMAAVVCVALRYRSGSLSILVRLRQLFGQWALNPENTPPNLKTVLTLSDVLGQLGVWCTALILVALVPWYGAASSAYSTYTREYAWAVSASFLSGLTPVIVEILLYCSILAAMVAIAAVLVARQVSIAFATAQSTKDAGRALVPAWQRALVYAAFLAVNVTVVVGVNAGFVAITLTQSSAVLAVAQILLSVFKLLWNTVCTPHMTRVATAYLSATSTQADPDRSLTAVQVTISLFNNIAIPCLVVAVLSPSCFYGVFDPAPDVTSTYFLNDCVVGRTSSNCANLELATSQYSPPFRYDYQCSSSFITYYAPAFVYLGLAAGVATPAVEVACLLLLQRLQPRSRLYAAVTRILPPLLRPLPIKPAEVAPVNHGVDAETLAGTAVVPFFQATNHFICLITYLGILLTFGVVFPPLAVVMCATMLSVVWQARLSLGRFLVNAKDRSAPQLTEALELDCRGAVSVKLLYRSIFVILCFACCFYALFLFDTLGDAVGFHGAYWVLIVMPLLPLLLYGAILLWRLRRNRAQGPRARPTVDKSDAVMIEMPERGGKQFSSSLASDQSDETELDNGTMNALHVA